MNPLSNKSRWLYGALGGLSPLLVTATSVDYAAVFEKFELFAFLGWLARAGMLAFLGGLVAHVFLDQEEHDRKRAFLIGVGAPAMMAAYINGQKPADPPRQISTDVIPYQHVLLQGLPHRQELGFFKSES